MAFRNLFKKRKSKEKTKKEVTLPEEIKEEKPSTSEGEESKLSSSPFATAREVKVQKRKEKIIGQGYNILKFPHVTEKAADLAKKNQYIFKVAEKANKIEIKKAIENIYGVDILSVRIIKIPKKPRRLGKQRGWKKGYKKAIVKLKEGQKIEVLPR